MQIFEDLVESTRHVFGLWHDSSLNRFNRLLQKIEPNSFSNNFQSIVQSPTNSNFAKLLFVQRCLVLLCSRRFHWVFMLLGNGLFFSVSDCFSTDSVWNSMRFGAAGHCASERKRLGLFASFCITQLLHTGRRWTKCELGWARMSSASPDRSYFFPFFLLQCHLQLAELSSTCSIFFRRSKDMEMLAWTLSALRLRLSHGCVESRANMVWCGSHDVVWCPRVRLNIQELESTKNQLN